MRPLLVDLFFCYNIIMKHLDINQFNLWAKNHIFDDSLFDDDGFIISQNNEHFKSTGIISSIFQDHWDSYYFKYKHSIDILRPNANKEFHKIIDCANHNLGYTVYSCNKCKDIIFSHHTCKGKLCSSCGIKFQKIKTQNILEKCINVKHRHITFTIPNSLCLYFFEYLPSTDLLFQSVSDTLYSTVNGKVKKKISSKYKLKYSPGFFAFLHTFGRPLNFNTHIHVIIAEYVVDKNKNLKKFNYFNYDALSKRFMKILLDKMEKHFGKDKFKDTKNKMYLKYKNGFYVNNKLEDDGYKFNSIEELIRYLTRYCSRPAMAESRILNYDGNNVTFYYSDHTNKQYHEETNSAFEFITKILRHLLPENFKSIRSYGFYNKSSKLCDNIKYVISREKIRLKREILKWKNLILTSFNRIPIICPHCGELMKPLFEVS